MTLKKDLCAIANCRQAWRPGLQAIRGSDKKKITASKPQALTGSADLDLALKQSDPNGARWDYVIGVARSQEELCWVEIHPASGAGNITEIHAKLEWLKQWLNAEGSQLRGYKRQFVWIASGHCSYQQNSPQLKKLALAGLRLVGGHLQLD